MKILVTGASGHIGNTLVRALLARGDRVRVLGHGATKSLEGLDVEVVPGDVLNAAEMRAAVDGMELVYHLAAVISIDGDASGLARKVNVIGPRNVANAALDAGVRRLVHVSSIHAFDHDPAHEPLDETRRRAGPDHPVYDQTKVAGEAAVREAMDRGLDAVIVHPTGVIGPNDYGPSHIGGGLIGFASQRFPFMPRGGFNWTDVRDITRSLIAAAEHGRTGENYILGGHFQSALELTRLCGTITGIPGAVAEIPLGVAMAMSHAVLATSRVLGMKAHFTPDAMFAMKCNRFISFEKAARELGHTARPTLETLRDTYTWFAQHGQLPHLADRLLGKAPALDLAS